MLLALDGKSFLKKIFVEFDFAKIEEEKTNFYLILVCERRDFKQTKNSFGWMQATRATFYKYREFRDRKKNLKIQ